MAECAQNLNRAPDDLKDFIPVQQLVVFRVHLCALVVNPAVQLRGLGCSGGRRVNRWGR
jgi:hypothetical protein